MNLRTENVVIFFFENNGDDGEESDMVESFQD